MKHQRRDSLITFTLAAIPYLYRIIDLSFLCLCIYFVWHHRLLLALLCIPTNILSNLCLKHLGEYVAKFHSFYFLYLLERAVREGRASHIPLAPARVPVARDWEVTNDDIKPTRKAN